VSAIYPFSPKLANLTRNLEETDGRHWGPTARYSLNAVDSCANGRNFLAGYATSRMFILAASSGTTPSHDAFWGCTSLRPLYQVVVFVAGTFTRAWVSQANVCSHQLYAICFAELRDFPLNYAKIYFKSKLSCLYSLKRDCYIWILYGNILIYFWTILFFFNDYLKLLAA
jgi:hypothetical protein